MADNMPPVQAPITLLLLGAKHGIPKRIDPFLRELSTLNSDQAQPSPLEMPICAVTAADPPQRDTAGRVGFLISRRAPCL